MLDTDGIIEDFINEAWWSKENSNIPFSVMSLNNKIAEAAHKNYYFSHVYTPDIKEAYEQRLFHIHNLGQLTTYCVGWNIEDILKMGFKGQSGRQSSKPAKHLRTALGQINNFMYTLQGESAGAQALSNFDTYLAPFIRQDHMNQDDVNQCIQEFIFNMNVPTRVGGQQPFTNITLDQQIPKFMDDDNVIFGGKYTDDTYGSYQDEMDMLNNAWWTQRIKGDADGRPQPFPIETLNVTKDFNWDDETLFKAVAIRGSPYFSNFVNTDMNPEDVRSMCCRLRIDNTVLKKRGGGYFGSSPLTGSIGVVTLNMPLIAYLTKDETKFLQSVEAAMELAKKSLELKRIFIEKNTKVANTLYPYSKIYLKSVFDRFGEYWKNHFNTIGLIGMNEACTNLLGDGISSSEGLKFGVKVLNFMRQKALDFQDETDNMYNIEATPGEGTSFRLAMLDKKQYPKIVTAGIAQAPYYTNSSQLPVDCSESIGWQIKHQSKLQSLYTGGTVQHFFNGEERAYWEGVSKFMKNVIYRSELPYTTYTPTTSVCPTHGLMAGKHYNCPKCNAVSEVWTRITGYFSPVQLWNPGKAQEFVERHHYEIEQAEFQ